MNNTNLNSFITINYQNDNFYNNLNYYKNSILEKINFFNDPNFVFLEKYHKYYYNDIEFISVTKLIHDFSIPFDKDYWSEKKSRELGIPKEKILLEWSEKNKNSIKIGKEFHKWVENYYNKIWQELPNNKDVINRINKFNILYADFLHLLEPIKFELKIFSKRWRIAGTVDSLFLSKDNRLIMIDWKTNNDFTHDDHPKGRYQKFLSPFDNYYKNNLNEYSIQLSVYSLILNECGLMVNDMYLIHVGPENEEPRIYNAKDYREILYDYLNNSSKYKIL